MAAAAASCPAANATYATMVVMVATMRVRLSYRDSMKSGYVSMFSCSPALFTRLAKNNPKSTQPITIDIVYQPAEIPNSKALAVPPTMAAPPTQEAAHRQAMEKVPDLPPPMK